MLHARAAPQKHAQTAGAMLPSPLTCPLDRSVLTVQADSYRCIDCGRIYPVQDGVVRLLERDDAFYEGTYENQVNYVPRNERPWHVWPLWLINSGYPWIVRHFVSEGSTVVELGCAGGVKYFGKRYRMIGCDLSFASLRMLKGIYERLIQADAAAFIPLPDQSVDAIVSSYFWEHISPEIKPRILAECARILRPGGKLIFLYDVTTQNPLIRRYRAKNIELYNELFIECDGHLGYQTPGENLQLFRRAGFRVLKHQGMEKTIFQSASAYYKLGQYGGCAKIAFSWATVLGKSPWFYPYTLLMRLLDTVIGPWLPENYARMDLVVCEKEVQ